MSTPIPVRFDVSWDTSVWLLTTVSLGLILFSLLVLTHVYRKSSRARRKSRWLTLLGIIFLSGLTLYAALGAPRGYVLDTDTLIIERLMGPKRIVFGPHTEVTDLKGYRMRGGARVFGSGGLFGYYGTFQHRDIGTYYLAATRKDHRILIRDSAQTVIVTPDDVPGFLQEANRRLKPSVKYPVVPE